MTEISLAYDMRAPDMGAPAVDLYGAAVEQSAWADKLGFGSVVVMEHHATTDGYLPSPIVLAAAIAGATERILIRLSLVLLPLYHPLRAAEDLAVLDLVSGGRMRTVSPRNSNGSPVHACFNVSTASSMSDGRRLMLTPNWRYSSSR